MLSELLSKEYLKLGNQALRLFSFLCMLLALLSAGGGPGSIDATLQGIVLCLSVFAASAWEVFPIAGSAFLQRALPVLRLPVTPRFVQRVPFRGRKVSLTISGSNHGEGN